MNQNNTKPLKFGLIIFGLASFCLAQADQYQYTNDGTDYGSNYGTDYTDPTQMDYNSQGQQDYSLPSMVQQLPPIPVIMPSGPYSNYGKGSQKSNQHGNKNHGEK
jgi:hypothetical protein